MTWLKKALNSSNYDQESLVGNEEGNVSLEPEFSYHFKLFEGAARDQDNINDHETKALEKFDFSDYQICSNSFEGHSTQDCGKDTVTDVELKLTDPQGFSASMAFSDLLEDQAYEKLLVEYVSSLDEVWFEPKRETFERL